jgi:hypothetical protein
MADINDGERFDVLNTGMTLRDWLAGQALCGLMSDAQYHENCTFDDIAERSLKAADAVLAAREKKPTT